MTHYRWGQRKRDTPNNRVISVTFPADDGVAG